jgi:polar amino acid transport system permease protein
MALRPRHGAGSALRAGRHLHALGWRRAFVSCGASGWGDEIAFGVKVTVTLAIATLPIGLLLGFLIALAAQSEDKLLRGAVGIYTTIFRGLPELLTLFIVYYGLQLLIQSILGWMGIEQRLEINAFLAGMIALAVVFSSYASEVLLSAFRAIPRGQYEAGDALGLHRSRTMVLVIPSATHPHRPCPASAISG